MKKFSWSLLVATLLIVVSAVARLLPHMPNVSPVAAIALLGGSVFAFPWALIIPVAAMLGSDAVIGFDQLPVTLSVYGSFLLTVLLGRWLQGEFKPWRVLGASLGSSILFYLITNAAVWWYAGLYSRTFDGLILSYLFALPFFRNSLLGDMVYTFSLFLSINFLPGLARHIASLLWYNVRHGSTGSVR